MIQVFLPQYRRTLRLQEDETLLELFQREGFYLPSDCAGNGTCGKCRILLEGDVPPAREIEKKHLAEETLAAGVRLSCQVIPRGDCQVKFFPQEQAESDQVLCEGRRSLVPLNPATRREVITVPQPMLDQHQFDLESLRKAMPPGLSLRPPLDFLRKLPLKLREHDNRVAILYNDSHFIAVEDAREGALYGLAVDLGTTTLVVKLIDLTNGVVRATSAGLNPQQRMGADVISRIGYAQQRNHGLKRLQRVLIDRVNQLIHSVTLSEGISSERVSDVAVVGNTVMGHLFLGLDATNLAFSPYTPVVQFYPEILAAEIGLAVNPVAGVQLLPNIGRFVGGDTTGVILATAMDQTQKLTLAIDIGTNGEIVLGKGKELLTTSTAAGPAFEGARIRKGMRAVEGAIDRITIANGELTVHTIRNAPPRGICGSGLISIVGELLQVGVLTDTGFMRDPEDHGNRNKKIFSRIGNLKQEKIFTLHQDGEKKVYITQKDVRELQLAKSAIRTGINLLLAEFGVSASDLDRVLLAGAFGNFIDREQAMRIGLLPEIEREKIRFVGNAACAGAELFLLSREMRQRAYAIARSVRYVEIATHPEFHDQYAENMLFPRNRANL